MNSRRKFLKNTSLAAASLAAGKIFARQEKEIYFAPDEPLFLPPRLKKGDTIALTAPAGAIFNEDSIQKATVAFEAQGFYVKHGDTLKQKFGYLAGTDEFRGKELNDLFADKTVNGIVAMRGGWGCARLFYTVDFNIIRQNPKVISGFSDITSLLVAIYKKTGLITFHGPVGNSTLEGFTMDNFLRIVKDGEPMEMVQPASDPLSIVSDGKATGKLFGGNLSVWCSLAGTNYLPDIRNALFFFEETEEEPYEIDRMLTQLYMINGIAPAAGIIIGKCTKCDAEEPDKSFTLDEVYRQKFGNMNVPVATGFSFGHIRDKFTFPVGAPAVFDTASSSVKLLQSCVV
jgi:muramoyltetrapeptide carboxypeptidase